MKKPTIFERMAKEERLNISESITSFISVPMPKSKVYAASVYSDDIDFTVIKPEKIHYNFDLNEAAGHSADALLYFLHKIEHQKQNDMLLLEKAGIPVFINNNTETKITHDYYGSRITATYQIPEELMYKSFWVLHSFSKATEYAGQYAMQQVQKVIYKY